MHQFVPPSELNRYDVDPFPQRVVGEKRTMFGVVTLSLEDRNNCERGIEHENYLARYCTQNWRYSYRDGNQSTLPEALQNMYVDHTLIAVLDNDKFAIVVGNQKLVFGNANAQGITKIFHDQDLDGNIALGDFCWSFQFELAPTLLPSFACRNVWMDAAEHSFHVTYEVTAVIDIPNWPDTEIRHPLEIFPHPSQHARITFDSQGRVTNTSPVYGPLVPVLCETPVRKNIRSWDLCTCSNTSFRASMKSAQPRAAAAGGGGGSTIRRPGSDVVILPFATGTYTIPVELQIDPPDAPIAQIHLMLQKHIPRRNIGSVAAVRQPYDQSGVAHLNLQVTINEDDLQRCTGVCGGSRILDRSINMYSFTSHYFRLNYILYAAFSMRGANVGPWFYQLSAEIPVLLSPRPAITHDNNTAAAVQSHGGLAGASDETTAAFVQQPNVRLRR